jgi:hypothetical protein
MQGPPLNTHANIPAAAQLVEVKTFVKSNTHLPQISLEKENSHSILAPSSPKRKQKVNPLGRLLAHLTGFKKNLSLFLFFSIFYLS